MFPLSIKVVYFRWLIAPHSSAQPQHNKKNQCKRHLHLPLLSLAYYPSPLFLSITVQHYHNHHRQYHSCVPVRTLFVSLHNYHLIIFTTIALFLHHHHFVFSTASTVDPCFVKCRIRENPCLPFSAALSSLILASPSAALPES